MPMYVIYPISNQHSDIVYKVCDTGGHVMRHTTITWPCASRIALGHKVEFIVHNEDVMTATTALPTLFV